MYKTVATTLAALVLATSVQAEEHSEEKRAELRACLAEKVTATVYVESKEIVGSRNFHIGWDHTVYADVTNNLPWAISGAGVEYTIQDPNRSVPWEEDDAYNSVSGGIEPGETRRMYLRSTILDKEVLDTSEYTGVVLEVFDAERRMLVGAVTVVGGDLSDELSPLACE